MPLPGHVISLYENSDIRILRETCDTKIIFATWVLNNVAAQMQMSCSIVKFLVIFIMTGLHGKDF